jgi:predicted nuclease of predicted toxin-antitoxin system
MLSFHRKYPSGFPNILKSTGLRNAEDYQIFLEAKKADVVVMTKDSDFIDLQMRFGAPPKIIWLTCGNTSNEKLTEILSAHLLNVLELLNSNNNLVEVSG